MGSPVDRLRSLADSLHETRLTRRQLVRRSAAIGLAAPALPALLAACAEDDDDDTDDPPAADTDDDTAVDDPDDDDTDDDEDVDEPDDDDSDDDVADGESDDERYGGALYDAMIGELPAHDPHYSTAAVVGHVLFHVYEHLFTYDANMEVQPELTDTIDVSDDGLTVTLTIRDGVQFHDGEPLTSADVIASIERWGELSARAGIIPDVATLNEVDDLTVEFDLEEPIGPLQHMLARQNQGCTIHPKWVIDEVGTSTIENSEHYIGTGPYKYEDYQPDRHFHLVRFEDYASHQGETSGYYGMKHQYLDEIYFIPVPDESSRIAGLQAGDYHYVNSMHADNFDRLESDPNVEPQQLPPQGWSLLICNMRDGLLADQEMRRAVQVSLCCDEIMLGAYAEGWYQLDPSVVVGADAWYTRAGEELYNVCDPERGLEIAQEAGYDGEPIRWFVTQEYQNMYDFTVVAAQQLEDAGFNIDLQIYDWATLFERHSNEEDSWEITTMTHSFRPEPLALTPIPGGNHGGWWDTPEKNELVAQLQREAEHEVRFEIWEQLQELWYEQVPRIKIGDQLTMHAMSANLRGWTETVHLQVAHFNHWLED